MFKFRRLSWSDNDHQWGPFLYAKQDNYRPVSVVLRSGDGDEYRGCSLRFSGFGHNLIIGLPQLIKPFGRKIQATSWDAATVARMGRDYYVNYEEREYGFSCVEGHFNVYLGRQTHDSSTEQRWSTFLPWTQWRFIRWSLYDQDGEWFYTELATDRKFPNRTPLNEAQQLCPKRAFAFRDYDNEALVATTHIREAEHRFGEGWFKWLSWFRKPMITRSLDIRFSGETGRRKGSWKGGTIGSGITLLPGELHELAFRRYCKEHQMTFLGPTTEPGPQPAPAEDLTDVAEPDRAAQVKG